MERSRRRVCALARTVMVHAWCMALAGWGCSHGISPLAWEFREENHRRCCESVATVCKLQRVVIFQQSVAFRVRSGASLWILKLLLEKKITCSLRGRSELVSLLLMSWVAMGDGV